MTAHTPGPWRIIDGTFVYKLDESEQNRFHLQVAAGFAGRNRTSTEEIFANARLIAAAPDLLAALEIVVSDWTAQFERNGHLAPTWCKQARAAIAKATKAKP